MPSELLHKDIQDAVSRLSGLLKGLILAAGSDPGKPQFVHRKFGIDRVLCWKVSRLIKAPSAEEALRNLPGEESFAIFTSAAERAGAPAADARLALEASRNLYAAIQQRVGDKHTLELMLDGVGQGRDGLMASRKLAFRGNSGILGVQARTRVQMHVLAPSEQGAGMVDVATAAGWVDFRRLRPSAPWRLFRRKAFHDPAIDAMQPLGKPNSEHPMMLDEFCQNMPPLRSREDGEYIEYEVGPSAAGNTGAFTVYAAFIQRGMSMQSAYGLAPGARLASNVLAPVEQLVMDVLIHRSLPLQKHISSAVHSAAFNDGTVRDTYSLLPMDLSREELGSPPLMAGAHAPRQQELAEHLMTQCGWNIADFVGVRLQIDFPPFPSNVTVSLDLDE